MSMIVDSSRIRTKITAIIKNKIKAKNDIADQEYEESNNPDNNTSVSLENDDLTKSESKLILPSLNEREGIRKQRNNSPIKKVRSNNISSRYLKEHVKFKNTAEFFLNIMQDRVNQLENDEKFHKIKSKKLLKKLNKKALKIATSRLKVKNLLDEKPVVASTKIKFKDLPFNDKSFAKSFKNEQNRRFGKGTCKIKNEVITESNKSNNNNIKRTNSKKKKNEKSINNNSNFMFQTNEFFKTYSTQDSRVTNKDQLNNRVSRIC